MCTPVNRLASYTCHSVREYGSRREERRDVEMAPNARPVFCRWKEAARKDGIICAMQEPISDDRTVAGGGKDMIRAGRYHILCQLGQGGKSEK